LQGTHLTELRLELELLFTAAEPEDQLQQAASWISTWSALLLGHGVQVLLTARSVPNERWLPPPAVFAVLGPFLHELDYHRDPEQPVITGIEDISSVSKCLTVTFDSLHATCLMTATLLQTLCVTGRDLILPIATLHTLTKLHLTALHGHPDFQPLVQLESIEALALQCTGRSSSCPDVLHSSRASLRRVELTSYSWDNETYSALQNILALSTLNVKVHHLTCDAAQILGDISAPKSVQISLWKCQEMQLGAFRALTSGSSKIHSLIVWGISDEPCRQLQSMPDLVSLTAVRCSAFTGCGLQAQPRVKTVTLVSCFGITDTGVRNIVDMCPALKAIAFQAELSASQLGHPQYVAEGRLVLPVHALVALSASKRLSFVDLTVVTDITLPDLHALHSCFRAQQASGQAQPVVSLLLSMVKHQSQQQPTLLVLDNVLFPCLYKMPTSWISGVSSQKVFSFGKVTAYEDELLQILQRCLLHILSQDLLWEQCVS